jgi:hypothetical protein
MNRGNWAYKMMIVSLFFSSNISREIAFGRKIWVRRIECTEATKYLYANLTLKLQWTTSFLRSRFRLEGNIKMDKKEVASINGLSFRR